MSLLSSLKSAAIRLLNPNILMPQEVCKSLIQLADDVSSINDAASSGGSGVTAMAAIGATPNANGATISGSTLNLQPASASFGGIVTTGAQSFAGIKTFSGVISAAGLYMPNGSGGGGITFFTNASAGVTGGGVTIQGQNGNNSAGGDVNIYGGQGFGSNHIGGTVNINGGQSPGDTVGGDVFISGGNGLSVGKVYINYSGGGIVNTNLIDYASNALAITGGLVQGDLYRTGGVVMIVI